MMLSNNSPSNNKLSQVSPRFSLYIFPHDLFRFCLQFWRDRREAIRGMQTITVIKATDKEQEIKELRKRIEKE